LLYTHVCGCCPKLVGNIIKISGRRLGTCIITEALI